jgi:hypothetical protein
MAIDGCGRLKNTSPALPVLEVGELVHLRYPPHPSYVHGPNRLRHLCAPGIRAGSFGRRHFCELRTGEKCYC